jgi:hypothetical protein
MDDDIMTASNTAFDETAATKWRTAASLARGSKAILFENGVVTVSMIAEYRQFQGRIAVFVKNNNSTSIDINSLDINATAAAVDGGALNLKQQPVSSARITSGEETRSLIALDCSQPFSTYPNLEVTFVHNNSKYRYVALYIFCQMYIHKFPLSTGILCCFLFRLWRSSSQCLATSHNIWNVGKVSMEKELSNRLSLHRNVPLIFSS